MLPSTANSVPVPLSPRLPPTHASSGPRWHGQSGPTLSGNLCFTVQAGNTPCSSGLSPEFQGMSQPQAVLCQWWEQDHQLWALVPLTSLQARLLAFAATSPHPANIQSTLAQHTFTLSPDRTWTRGRAIGEASILRTTACNKGLQADLHYK